MHQGHSERPAELHGLDVFADDAAFFARQGLEPFAHRLVARSSAEESDGEDWFCAICVLRANSDSDSNSFRMRGQIEFLSNWS
jgi:hypothetical protein